MLAIIRNGAAAMGVLFMGAALMTTDPRLLWVCAVVFGFVWLSTLWMQRLRNTAPRAILDNLRKPTADRAAANIARPAHKPAEPDWSLQRVCSYLRERRVAEGTDHAICVSLRTKLMRARLHAWGRQGDPTDERTWSERAVIMPADWQFLHFGERSFDMEPRYWQTVANVGRGLPVYVDILMSSDQVKREWPPAAAPSDAGKLLEGEQADQWAARVRLGFANGRLTEISKANVGDVIISPVHPTTLSAAAFGKSWRITVTGLSGTESLGLRVRYLSGQPLVLSESRHTHYEIAERAPGFITVICDPAMVLLNDGHEAELFFVRDET